MFRSPELADYHIAFEIPMKPSKVTLSKSLMTRLFCLVLVAAFVTLAGDLSGYVPDRKPDNKEPPKHFTNSIGMKFVRIPPGKFMMGSPKEEVQRGAKEIQHKVTLTKGFYMGVYTVTQEEWQALMGNNRSEEHTSELQS